MSRIATRSIAICAAAGVFLLAQIGAGFADGDTARIVHHKQHATIAYYDYGPDYGPCRIGWWQTLRYGHVRPAWGEWCR
jgi:hypothetical protein